MKDIKFQENGLDMEDIVSENEVSEGAISEEAQSLVGIESTAVVENIEITISENKGKRPPQKLGMSIFK